MPRMHSVDSRPYFSFQVDLAVKAARKAFQSWRNVPGGGKHHSSRNYSSLADVATARAALLNKLADLIEKHTDEIALMESASKIFFKRVGLVSP